MAVAKALPPKRPKQTKRASALDLATPSQQLGWSHFLLVLGACFSFIARQKRMPVGGEGYFLDLLFFPRGRKRLIAIEPKLGDFKPADKGQMELYLRWLDKHERPTRRRRTAPSGDYEDAGWVGVWAAGVIVRRAYAAARLGVA
jgi:hypothetical protein